MSMHKMCATAGRVLAGEMLAAAAKGMREADGHGHVRVEDVGQAFHRHGALLGVTMDEVAEVLGIRRELR